MGLILTIDSGIKKIIHILKTKLQIKMVLTKV